MKKIQQNLFKFFLFIVLLSHSQLALADKTIDDIKIPKVDSVTTLGDVSDMVVYVINWLGNMFWILSVGMLVWAAWLYLSGNEDNIKEARERIKYALYAAAVALLATALRAIVTNVLIA